MSNPSISTSSWLSVCSRSEFWSEPRRAPTASSSSMKMIAGRCSRASANRRRIRAAPRPANISTNEAADWLKNCAPDSCATALASSVLPVPGGPCSMIPFGTCAPERGEPLGVAQELDHLAQLRLRLVAAGDVGPGDRGRGLRLDLLRLRPRHQLERPPDEEHQQAHEDDRGPGDDPVLDLVPGERDERHCDQYAPLSAVRARVQTPYVRPGRAHGVAVPGAPARRPARHRGARLRARLDPRGARRDPRAGAGDRRPRGPRRGPDRRRAPLRRRRRVRQQQRRAAGRPPRAAPVRPPRRRAGGLPLGERDVRRLAGLGGAAGRALRPPRDARRGRARARARPSGDARRPGALLAAGGVLRPPAGRGAAHPRARALGRGAAPARLGPHAGPRARLLRRARALHGDLERPAPARARPLRAALGAAAGARPRRPARRAGSPPARRGRPRAGARPARASRPAAGSRSPGA